MTTSSLPGDLREVAALALPGRDLTGATVAQGQFHTVVLLPGVAVVRVARTPAAAAELPRRAALSGRIAAARPPFRVPEPLGDVVTTAGLTGVALTWLDGAGTQRGQGDPRQLAALLDALAAIDVAGLDGVLGVPHEYAGRERWAELMTGEVIDRLPPAWRAGALERVREAIELPPVPAGLVHGDLAGANVHWDGDGRVTGVLDWDLAAAWDPAVDAACLAWHGWAAVRAAVPSATLRRARVRYRTFGLEQIARDLLDGAPEPDVAAGALRAAAWLDRTRDVPPPA